jgi:hypothetical protein
MNGCSSEGCLEMKSSHSETETFRFPLWVIFGSPRGSDRSLLSLQEQTSPSGTLRSVSCRH